MEILEIFYLEEQTILHLFECRNGMRNIDNNPIIDASQRDNFVGMRRHGDDFDLDS